MVPPRATRRGALALGGALLSGRPDGVRSGSTGRSGPGDAGDANRTTRPVSSEPDGSWPQLGGSAGHAGAAAGVSGGRPDERWATRVDGPVTAPTVADGNAYVGRGVPAGDGGGRPAVEAYAVDSGERRWSLPLSRGDAASGGGPPAAPPRPVSHGGRLFAGVGDAVVAVDPSGPERLWTSERVPGLRFADPPTATGSRIYAGGPFGLAAFDHDGRLRWTFPEGAADGGFPPPGSPRVVAAVGGTVCVPMGDALVALDPADGSERWRHEDTGARASAVVGDGDVFVRAGADRVEAVGTDGRRRWVADWPGAAVARPATSDGTVYLAGPAGYVAAYGRADGERRWLTRVGPERYAEGTVATVSRRAVHLLRVDDGTRSVAAVALDRASGRVAWTVERSGTRAGGVVPAAGRYLFATADGGPAGAAGTTGGSTLWAFEPRE